MTRMSRYDRRWLLRHPLMWVRVMWLPWVVAAVLVGKAFVISQPVFGVTTAAPVWPVLLALLAGMMIACAVAPLDLRLQAFTASLLFAIAILRILTYGDTLVRADLGSGGRSIAVGFALHWTLIAAMSAWWPTIVEEAGQRMAVESGRDDRGVD